MVETHLVVFAPATDLGCDWIYIRTRWKKRQQWIQLANIFLMSEQEADSPLFLESDCEITLKVKVKIQSTAQRSYGEPKR